MVVLGIGVGLCMPVPTVVVQSTVDYKDLGVATSGVSFLRTMGSSFGVAVFGSIYATQLPEKLAGALTPGVDPRLASTIEGVRSLPPAAREPITAAYADALHVVFLAAVPVAAVGFVVALLLKEIPLRDTARMSAGGNAGVGESFAAPASFDSEHELQKLIALVVQKHKGGHPGPEVLAQSGLPLSMAQTWMIMRVFRGGADSGSATLAEITGDLKVPPGVFEPLASQLVADGLLSETLGHYRFTPTGLEMFQRFVGAWRQWLLARLEDWEMDNAEDFSAAIDRITEQMIKTSQALTIGKHASRQTPNIPPTEVLRPPRAPTLAPTSLPRACSHPPSPRAPASRALSAVAVGIQVDHRQLGGRPTGRTGQAPSHSISYLFCCFSFS